jgi:glycolate oxidase FAD binding subunit
VNLRLHPLPAARATALGSCADAATLAAAARTLAARPLELEALDVAWSDGRGTVLARCAGSQARRRAQRALELMRATGLERLEVADEDAGVWERQRAAQRSETSALVRVAARPSALAAVLRAVNECGGTLVGRAALGSSFIELEPEAVPRLGQALPPGALSVLVDAPRELREMPDRWGAIDPPALELMRRVKARFDPARVCNPGVFVGGI